MNGPTTGTEVLNQQARDALREKPLTSITIALKATAGFAGLASIFGAALIQLKFFSLEWLIALSAATILVFIVVLLVFEIERLRRCREALGALVADPRSPDTIIAEARQERDRLAKELDAVRAQLALFVAARSVLVDHSAVTGTPPTVQNDGETETQQ